MNFDLFFTTIPKVKDIALPSKLSHLKMAPLDRITTLEKNVYDVDKVKKAAVMMLFYPKNNIPHLVLIVRNSYSGVHSSQIAFPGGKVEIEDLNLTETAVRETFEEIGIAPEEINVIREFSSIYIPPSNFLVFPFLGISRKELTFTLQTEEVAGIIELPLLDLLNDAIITNKIIETSSSISVSIPVFQINEHTVWGATAMIMSELKDVLKMVL